MNEHDFKPNPVNITICADPAYCGRLCQEAGLAGGEEAIFRAFKTIRNELGLKGQVMTQKTSCQGWCDYAPVVTVWPDGRVYHGIKPEEAEAFIQGAALEDKGTFADRKVWDFRLGDKENHEERKLNGVSNPAHAES